MWRQPVFGRCWLPPRHAAVAHLHRGNVNDCRVLRISHTLAARMQFESRASDRTRSLLLLPRLLGPIEKPLDFRFR